MQHYRPTELAVTTEYYLGQMTDRPIACIANGATVALCGRANLAQSVWWCSSESPIEGSEEETEGLCLCETLKAFRQRSGSSNTLLF